MDTLLIIHLVLKPFRILVGHQIPFYLISSAHFNSTVPYFVLLVDHSDSLHYLDEVYIIFQQSIMRSGKKKIMILRKTFCQVLHELLVEELVTTGDSLLDWHNGNEVEDNEDTF